MLGYSTLTFFMVFQRTSILMINGMQNLKQTKKKADVSQNQHLTFPGRQQALPVCGVSVCSVKNTKQKNRTWLQFKLTH